MQPDLERATWKTEPTGMVSALEAHATNLCRRVSLHDVSPEATVLREIALVVGHLVEIRATHRLIKKSLDEQTCEINSAIWNLNPRWPEYGHPHGDAFRELKLKLEKIEAERRRLVVQTIERLMPLQDRLSQLVVRHTVLAS